MPPRKPAAPKTSTGSAYLLTALTGEIAPNDIPLSSNVTPDQLAAFQAEFEALCARFREDEAAADDPTGRVIQLSLYAFPFEAEPS